MSPKSGFCGTSFSGPEIPVFFEPPKDRNVPNSIFLGLLDIISEWETSHNMLRMQKSHPQHIQGWLWTNKNEIYSCFYGNRRLLWKSMVEHQIEGCFSKIYRSVPTLPCSRLSVRAVWRHNWWAIHCSHTVASWYWDDHLLSLDFFSIPRLQRSSLCLHAN